MRPAMLVNEDTYSNLFRVPLHANAGAGAPGSQKATQQKTERGCRDFHTRPVHLCACGAR